MRWHGAKEIPGDFFSLRFFGACPPRPDGRGRPLVPPGAPWTLAVLAPDSIGHLLGPSGWGARLPRRTRLLTRLLEEVWFPGHACHALLSSLFTSLFAGKREAGPKLKGKGLGTHQTVAHSAASQGFGRLVIQSRRNGAQKMHPKRPETQISLGVSHCGPPPPRQAAGDLTRARNGF